GHYFDGFGSTADFGRSSQRKKLRHVARRGKCKLHFGAERSECELDRLQTAVVHDGVHTRRAWFCDQPGFGVGPCEGFAHFLDLCRSQQRKIVERPGHIHGKQGGHGRFPRGVWVQSMIRTGELRASIREARTCFETIVPRFDPRIMLKQNARTREESKKKSSRCSAAARRCTSAI